MPSTIGVVCSVGVGPHRGGRDVNEDNYLVAQHGRAAWRHGDSEQTLAVEGAGILLAVADGMGGHSQGDVAATAAVRVLAKLYGSGSPRRPDQALVRYVREAHEQLHARAGSQGEVRMGTTLTACWILKARAGWVQVGDSALYLFREQALTRLTPVHTRGEFARRDGRQVKAESELAQGFIYGSRGLGSDATLRLDAGIDHGDVALRPGDRLLLCSDGLCDSVDDASIADVLRNTPEPQAAAVACMERAVARGSTDNITVLIARYDDETHP